MKLVEIVRGKVRAYRLVFEPAPGGGGYVVTCPALPSMVTEGETMKEALGLAHHAIEQCLEILAAREKDVPEGEVLFGGRV